MRGSRNLLESYRGLPHAVPPLEGVTPSVTLSSGLLLTASVRGCEDGALLTHYPAVSGIGEGSAPEKRITRPEGAVQFLPPSAVVRIIPRY
jgi:hypothetical protein